MRFRVPTFVVAAAIVVTVVIGVVLYVSPTREADAAAFARPNFDGASTDRGLDLTRYAALSRRKDLAKLSRDPLVCFDALAAADVDYSALKPIRTGKGCGVEDAVLLDKSLVAGQGRQQLEMTCALAARVYLWEQHVVAPAAEKHFGVKLDRIEAMGAYSCRTVAATAKMSEHAFGKAIDVGGFRLEDGRTISVLNDFRSKGAKGAFLREVRDRACDVFDVTLSPDYDAAHANHFHLDVGVGRACH